MVGPYATHKIDLFKSSLIKYGILYHTLTPNIFALDAGTQKMLFDILFPPKQGVRNLEDEKRKCP